MAGCRDGGQGAHRWAAECWHVCPGGPAVQSAAKLCTLPSANMLPLPSLALQPLTAALRKQLGAHSPGAGSSGGAVLTRVVGYVEDPGSSGDEGPGSNPFDLAGSSDDELEEGGGLVDRWVVGSSSGAQAALQYKPTISMPGSAASF